MKAYIDSYTTLTIQSTSEIIDKVEFETNSYSPKLMDHSDYYIYQIDISDHTLEIPKEYFITISSEKIPVDYRGIVKTKEFIERYSPIDSTLGSIVSGGNTTFRLYAPTTLFAYVMIEDVSYEMKRNNVGIFELTINENLHGKSYVYKTRVNHTDQEFTDPYAKASLPNRKASVVIDFRKLDFKNIPLKKIEDPRILELSVRDFTMDPEVSFNHRGQLLGLLESNNGYGMDFVLNLGINYIQLMPISDFETVDELDVLRKYNWGYDVMQFMSLEGSYSSNVLDPIQILKDLHKVINTYHSHDIGVIMDVVFNHVYDVESSPLHQSVPYYYFRYDENYNLTDGSFCGNEIATEMPLARKIIVDSCVYFVETFGVDGFRFDLMGLMDIETINEVDRKTRAINPHVLLYGEGWDMDDVYPIELRACMKNHLEMPNIKHFNDDYRDYIGGKTDTSTYAITNTSNSIETLWRYLQGISKPFSDSKYSINYIECHDNYTIKDKMDILGGSLKNIEILNGIVALSKGTPFFHIGQTFGRDKKGEENSYNSPDHINLISWRLLSENRSMHESLRRWLSLRDEVLKQTWNLDDNSLYMDVPQGKIIIEFKDDQLIDLRLERNYVLVIE